MMELMICGGLGLLFGLVMQKCGFTKREGVQKAVLLRAWVQARTWLYTLGLGMLGTAFLCWLAVIDVDRLSILPLHSGVLIGGVAAGVGVGLAGALPGRLLGGVGGGRLLESLCGLAGCTLGLLAARYLPMNALRELTPVQQGTLFRLTLTDEWLLDGRFLGLACLGALICVSALAIRPRHESEGTAEAIVPDACDPDDELLMLDELEDEVEELDEDDPSAVSAVEAQCIVASAMPVEVDDALPELPVEDISDISSISRQNADRPSPMQDEALDDLAAASSAAPNDNYNEALGAVLPDVEGNEPAEKPDVASMKHDELSQPKHESEGGS